MTTAKTPAPFTKGQRILAGRVETAVVSGRFVFPDMRERAWEQEVEVLGIRRDPKNGGHWVKVRLDPRQWPYAHWMNIRTDSARDLDSPHYVQPLAA